MRVQARLLHMSLDTFPVRIFEGSRMLGVKVDACSLMTNHVHLLLGTLHS